MKKYRSSATSTSRRRQSDRQKFFWCYVLANVLLCGKFVYDNGWNSATQFEIGFHIVVFTALLLPYVIGMIFLEHLDAEIENKEEEISEKKDE